MPSPSTVLLRTQTDERLAALVRAGHERAFEALVERYRRALLRACRRILPEARAEDALQQTLVAAWNGLRRGDEVQELRPWLYRIARNTALNQLRQAGYDLDELVETLSATHDPEEEVVRRAVVRQTLAAVAALPDRQREALLRTAIEGRGQDEVARELGLTDTAVRALVHRARVRVRAAATAVLPLPMAGWVAAMGIRGAPMTERIGELAGGAGGAATLAKVGTIAVLAGGTVATAPRGADPPRAHRDRHPVEVTGRAMANARPAVARTTAAPRAAPTVAATATPHVVEAVQERPRAVHEHAEEVERVRHDDAGRRGEDHADDDHSGPGRGGDDAVEAPVSTPAPAAAPDEDHSGRGGGEEEDAVESREGSSGPGGDHGEDDHAP